MPVNRGRRNVNLVNRKWTCEGMKVYCKNCKYFNKKNLCSSHGKNSDEISLFTSKLHMQIVSMEGDCEFYKRKWYRFWVKV